MSEHIHIKPAKVGTILFTIDGTDENPEVRMDVWGIDEDYLDMILIQIMEERLKIRQRREIES